MKKETKITEEITIPEGISIDIEKNDLIIGKNEKSIRRSFDSRINAKVEGNKLIIETSKSKKKERKLMGTLKAHIKNILEGLNEPFKYKLQIATVHFPMTVSHDKSCNEIVIKNFLGEKKDRRIKICDNVDVRINKEIIELESFDIEKAGQSAANIEKGTKVRKRDRRIFQDGIFITEKPGRVFL